MGRHLCPVQLVEVRWRRLQGAQMIDRTTITELEMRDHYAQTGLAHLGISYERAIGFPAIKTALINSVDASRRADQRRALAHPGTYHRDAA